MRILAPIFSTPHPESGGITRMHVIADSLIQNGHEINFMASGYQAKVLSSMGYSVTPLPEPTFFGLPKFITSIMQKKIHNILLPVSMTNMWFLYKFAGNTQASFLKDSIKKALDRIKTFKPQGLLTDYSPVAYLLRKITNLPLASTYSEIMRAGHDSFFFNRNQKTIDSVLKTYGFSSEDIDNLFFGPNVLKIIPNIPELDTADSASSDIYYSGSLFKYNNETLADFPVDISKRYVFVYIGTGSIPLKKLNSVLPSVFSGKDNRVCVVGSSGVNKAYQKGAVFYYPYVPAQKILPYCDWTICHGGQNTITESLLNGVPLIIFPGNIWERRYNAEKIRQAGAGKMGEAKDFNTQWISGICRNPEPYREHSARLGIALKKTEGVNGAYKRLMDYYNKYNHPVATE